MDSVTADPILTDGTVQGHQEPADSRRHETRDVSAHWMGIGALLFVAAGVVLLPVLWGLQILFVRHPPEPAVAPSPLALVPRLAPPPRLQENPPADYAAFLRAERQELHSAGWVDRAHSIARIPIEQAEEEMLRQGVPTLPSDRPASSQPVSNQSGSDGHVSDESLDRSQLKQSWFAGSQVTRPERDGNAAEASGRLPVRLQPSGAQRLGIGPTGRAR